MTCTMSLECAVGPSSSSINYLEVEVQPFSDPFSIVSTPRVCGGDARIAGTRISVWIVALLIRQGAGVLGIQEAYPELTVGQIVSAIRYSQEHQAEIDECIRGNEDA